MKSSSYVIATLAALAAGIASAKAQYVSSEGHSYTSSCNASGYVFSSEYPVSRFIEGGAASRIEKGTEVIYLGKSCDASNKVLGSGKWCWANGGFVIEFEAGSRLGFPRQELYCPANDDLGLNCGC